MDSTLNWPPLQIDLNGDLLSSGLSVPPVGPIKRVNLVARQETHLNQTQYRTIFHGSMVLVKSTGQHAYEMLDFSAILNCFMHF